MKQLFLFRIEKKENSGWNQGRKYYWGMRQGLRRLLPKNSSNVSVLQHLALSYIGMANLWYEFKPSFSNIIKKKEDFHIKNTDKSD